MNLSINFISHMCSIRYESIYPVLYNWIFLFQLKLHTFITSNDSGTIHLQSNLHKYISQYISFPLTIQKLECSYSKREKYEVKLLLHKKNGAKPKLIALPDEFHWTQKLRRIGIYKRFVPPLDYSILNERVM